MTPDPPSPPHRTARITEPAEAARGRFFSYVRRQLRTLYRFVRHELAYRQSAGDLMTEELTVDDVVDAVLLRAFAEYVRSPRRRRSAGWLIRLANEHIESEVARLQALRETMPHLEEDVPETPPQEEVTTLGEEILYFYQPDEDLKLEDVMPDLALPSPEDVAADREARAVVSTALARMPAEWRRVLLLHHGEGLSLDELAEAVGRPRPEIERILEQGRERLRARMTEAGYPASVVTV